MKKLILFIIAVWGFVFNAAAQEKQTYKVTVKVKITYIYEDDRYHEVGRNYGYTTYNIDAYASSPYEAKTMALQECSNMCHTSNYKQEGKKTYNGKLYTCKSIKEPFEVVAVVKTRN